MRRSAVLFAVLGLAALAVFSSPALAEKKAVKLVKQWKGSAADADLAKDAPEYVADAKALEKLWKKWGVEGKVPEVDFKKEILLVSTTVGSQLNLSARLDDKGNLEVIGAATSDFGTGFRYVIATVSREGVKTINGKEVKEAGKEKD